LHLANPSGNTNKKWATLPIFIFFASGEPATLPSDTTFKLFGLYQDSGCIINDNFPIFIIYRGRKPNDHGPLSFGEKLLSVCLLPETQKIHKLPGFIDFIVRYQ
jgi:hypothetical protein